VRAAPRRDPQFAHGTHGPHGSFLIPSDPRLDFPALHLPVVPCAPCIPWAIFQAVFFSCISCLSWFPSASAFVPFPKIRRLNFRHQKNACLKSLSSPAALAVSASASPKNSPPKNGTSSSTAFAPKKPSPSLSP